MTKYEKAAQTVVNKCVDIKKGEIVLILASDPMLDIAQHLFIASSRKTRHTYFMQLPTFRQKLELHDTVANLMKQVNVVIALTTPSISYTPARLQASAAGVRIVSMPHITPHAFGRIPNTNFEKVWRRSRKLADILSMAKEVRVTAPNGTDLFIPIQTRRGVADTGLLDKPGAFSTLPGGKASIAPDDHGVEGLLIVDSGMGVHPKDRNQLSIAIKAGRGARISGGSLARRMSQTVSKYGPSSRLVAEFGIGINDAAHISGASLEDEKVLGNIQIAFGNNIGLGGQNDVPVMFNAIVYKASVEIDGKIILQRGKLAME